MSAAFDELARTISLDGGIDQSIAAEIYMQTLYLQHLDSNRPITLHIDSPGGVVDDCVALYDLLKELKAPVRTHCAGEARGGALLILSAGTKGLRSARTSAVLQLAQCYSDHHAVSLEEVAKADAVIARLLSDCGGQPEQRVAEAMAHGKVFTASEAQQWGLIDRVVP